MNLALLYTVNPENIQSSWPVIPRDTTSDDQFLAGYDPQENIPPFMSVLQEHLKIDKKCTGAC
jgi:hypothetical protein